MAERTGEADVVIPLSRWLAGNCPMPRRSEALRSSYDDGNDFDLERSANDVEALLASAREQAKNECQRETSAEVASVRQEERTNYEGREAKLVAQWSARCAEVTGTALSGLLQELRESIGKALADVLQPLLPGALHQRAITELIELLNREFATAGSKFLEIRAPPELHVKLREMVDQLGVQVAITESDRIEIVSSDSISRFEQLANAWVDLVLPGKS